MIRKEEKKNSLKKNQQLKKVIELRTEVGSQHGPRLGFSHMALLADGRAGILLLGGGKTLAREGRNVAWLNQ